MEVPIVTSLSLSLPLSLRLSISHSLLLSFSFSFSLFLSQGSRDGSGGTPCTTTFPPRDRDSIGRDSIGSGTGSLYSQSVLSPALLALSMYNYVPNLSPKNMDNHEEETSGFGSHSRFSYSLSSANDSSHNNSHNSLHSLCSQNCVTVCDKMMDTDSLIRAKDQVPMNPFPSPSF